MYSLMSSIKFFMADLKLFTPCSASAIGLMLRKKSIALRPVFVNIFNGAPCVAAGASMSTSPGATPGGRSNLNSAAPNSINEGGRLRSTSPSDWLTSNPSCSPDGANNADCGLALSKAVCNRVFSSGVIALSISS